MLHFKLHHIFRDRNNNYDNYCNNHIPKNIRKIKLNNTCTCAMQRALLTCVHALVYKSILSIIVKHYITKSVVPVSVKLCDVIAGNKR